jgi:hypothetical protein
MLYKFYYQKITYFAAQLTLPPVVVVIFDELDGGFPLPELYDPDAELLFPFAGTLPRCPPNEGT